LVENIIGVSARRYSQDPVRSKREKAKERKKKLRAGNVRKFYRSEDVVYKERAFRLCKITDSLDSQQLVYNAE
jgi:hypothetical protein